MNEPYTELAHAIVLRAVEDYRMAEEPVQVRSLESFFESEWFFFLSNLDGRAVLKKLREEKR